MAQLGVKRRYLIAEVHDSSADAAQRGLGGLSWIGKSGSVRAEPCGLGSNRAQRLGAQAGPQVIGCRGDQILELVERRTPRFDRTVAGNAQCADRFDDRGGVLRDHSVLRGQGAAGGILSIEWIGLAPYPPLPP